MMGYLRVFFLLLKNWGIPIKWGKKDCAQLSLDFVDAFHGGLPAPMKHLRTWIYRGEIGAYARLNREGVDLQRLVSRYFPVSKSTGGAKIVHLAHIYLGIQCLGVSLFGVLWIYQQKSTGIFRLTPMRHVPDLLIPTYYEVSRCLE